MMFGMWPGISGRLALVSLTQKDKNPGIRPQSGNKNSNIQAISVGRTAGIWSGKV